MATVNKVTIILSLIVTLHGIVPTTAEETIDQTGDQVGRSRRSSSVPTCTAEYQKIPGHTMCLRDKPNVIFKGLRRGAIRYILKQHNWYRGRVEPPANDMSKMAWNSKLAQVAQKWANQCPMDHDKVRTIPEFSEFVGQNVAWGQKAWPVAMKVWFDEIKYFRYGEKARLKPGQMIAHFTQQLTGCPTCQHAMLHGKFENQNFVHGMTVCAFAEYNTTYYVCDYMAGQTGFTHPYTAGKRCGKCPDTCQKGLCDCGGKFCRNGGTLDLNTCECKCQRTFTGEVCDKVGCPPHDHVECGTTFKASACSVHSTVRNHCPYMCKLCAAADKQKFEKVPKGTGMTVNGMDYFKSFYGCSFYGKRPTPEECRKFGAEGPNVQDVQYACAAYSDRRDAFDCNGCLKYYNVPTEYCPVMCGLCDVPCGKICYNFGFLDEKTCKCKCREPFYGPDCQDVDCSKPDPPHCRTLPRRACEMYFDVPGQCPRKCNKCNRKSG